ncbi:MAG: DNA polymerase IV [Lewinellaceae bacterium]|nr:DNA polymerase IV [Saprospiraceae bacterium]MCB9315656.1 DNA polymerase IV [Lewinellaceae bacterium]MCB9329999.1 DNA polymerase IV [Lewinellaceae bacterium]
MTHFNRAVLHLDLDAFYVAVECLRNDALRGKPLIIGGSSNRGVVASCSYEARAFGVRSAMPMRQALLLCPEATVLKGDMEAYSKHSALVRDVIEEQAPLFEQASIDEFYLDLTGMDRHIGCWHWSTELRERIIRETGLPLSVGLSVNKTVSKVGAGEVKPNGAKLVPAGTEKGFLAPLPVGKIPSIGRETERRLNLLGVRTCQTLSELPPRLLEREFGKHGLIMWKKANGEDDSPVVPYREQDSMSSERTFHADTIDLRFLQDEIRRQTAQLAYELRSKGKLTACVTIKLRYSDFNTFTRQAKIPYTAQDSPLTEQALLLFEKLYERRQGVRLLGVRFSELVPGTSQLNLFDDTEKESRLLAAMDKIRDRFGKGAVRKGGK